MSEELIIGVGHPHRGDDAAGLEVARRLRENTPEGTRVMETTGDATALMAAWRDYDSVTVVDAVKGGGEVGDILRLEADQTAPDIALLRSSTHAFGVAEAIALGRQLDELPRRLVVYGIEGRRFAVGAEMSPAVRAAVAALAIRLRLHRTSPDEATRSGQSAGRRPPKDRSNGTLSGTPAASDVGIGLARLPRPRKE